LPFHPPITFFPDCKAIHLLVVLISLFQYYVREEGRGSPSSTASISSQNSSEVLHPSLLPCSLPCVLRLSWLDILRTQDLVESADMFRFALCHKAERRLSDSFT
jgi:hypothetical protein